LGNNSNVETAGANAPVVITPSQVNLALWLLMFIHVLNALDRQILNILAEPISRELGLSDTQIGLMTGLAFALFYTTLGIPLARFADNPRSNRVGLMAVCLAVWSGMTAASAFAQSFIHMLVARIGVGAGEAGCTPAATSLFADIVPSHKRASAMAFYMMGMPIGSLMGLVVGGLVSDAYGWRAAFLVVGLPGLVMAVILWLVVKEPRRFLTSLQKPVGLDAAPPAPRISLLAVLREIAASRAFVNMLISSSVGAFLAQGKGVWTVIFFIRTHDLSPGQVGLWLGISAGFGGVVGSWIGGRLGDRFGFKNPRHYLTAPAIGVLIASPLYFFAYSAGDWRLAMLLLTMAYVLNTLSYGPVYATTQGIFRPEARAMAIAVKLFVQSLIGMGLGPLAFGIISDALKPAAGEDSVRWVLLCAAFLGLIPAIGLWRASLHLKREMIYLDR